MLGASFRCLVKLHTVFKCFFPFRNKGCAQWLPDAAWESLNAQETCDAFRFEIADLALQHLKHPELLHHTQNLCTDLRTVFSAQECGAATLLFALVLQSMSTSIVSPFLLRGLGAVNFRVHEWLRPCTRQQRAANRSRVELWCWLLGASRWLLVTAWQLHAGSRRQRVASRRLLAVPFLSTLLVSCAFRCPSL